MVCWKRELELFVEHQFLFQMKLGRSSEAERNSERRIVGTDREKSINGNDGIVSE